MTLAFGMERLGLAALKRPRAMLFLALLLTVLLFPGIFRVQFKTEIREIFRSDSPEFALFEEMARQYPGSETDIFLIVEGKGIFQPQALERLSALHMDMLAVEGVKDVQSLFSARYPLSAGEKATQPVFPFGLDEAPDVEELKREFLRHPLVSGKLLSQDATLALFLISLKSNNLGLEKFKEVVGGIRALADEAISGTGLSQGLTGVPVMRLEIIASLVHDITLFILLGFTFSLAIAWLFLHQLRYAVVATAPVLAAILWLTGAMGYLGLGFDILTTAVPALIIAITFSESLFMLFATRRNIMAGLAFDDALGKAVREVGPACFLTYLTTLISLLSLTLVSYDFVARFGTTAALGTGIAFLANITLIPALSSLFLRGVMPRDRGLNTKTRLVETLGRAASAVATARPWTLVILGICSVALLGLLYSHAEPQYRYRELLRENNPSLQAMKRIDEKLAGTSALALFLQWPRGKDVSSKERLDLIRDAHLLLEAEPLVKEVWSLHSVADWLGAGDTKIDAVNFLRSFQPQLKERLLSEEEGTALVTGQYVDADISVLIPELRGIESRLDQLRQRYPEVTISLTGINPLSAKVGYEMIGALRLNLLSTVVIIIILIGITLQSVKAGLFSILPNLLPITAGGAFLYLSGNNLQLVGIIAFTIGFGIAVDSTIHVLNHYRLSRDAGQDPQDAIGQTIVTLGPVLIISTAVLMAGFGVTLFSDMPKLQLFGQISVLLLFVALIGDILFLPAIILAVDGWRNPPRDDQVGPRH